MPVAPSAMPLTVASIVRTSTACQRNLERVRGGFRGFGIADAALREGGLEELREVVRPAPERGCGHPATDDGEHGKNHERHEHALRRFVRVDFVLVIARLAVKGEEDEAEHVEGGEQGGEQAEG